MYDSCGHDHCTRLNTDLPFALKGGHHDVALWLWEVHNAGKIGSFSCMTYFRITLDKLNLFHPDHIVLPQSMSVCYEKRLNEKDEISQRRKSLQLGFQHVNLARLVG